MAVIIAVQALAKAGRVDEANAQGQRGIDRLGELLPLMRGGIQASLAEGLRQAGRMEEAYEALAASVTLERQAAQQFAALQHDLAEAARERETALQEAARLRDEADRDWLTGLHNRRFLARLPLSGESTVGIALVDLDDFKAVNDTFGHEFGDRVLARVAQLLVAVARADDTVVRLGGDEFVVVMAGADRERALACAHRLQAALADEPWDTMDATLRVGASVGFTAGPSSTPLETLISQADRYLYRAKESGRGHVAGELDAL